MICKALTNTFLVRKIVASIAIAEQRETRNVAVGSSTWRPLHVVGSVIYESPLVDLTPMKASIIVAFACVLCLVAALENVHAVRVVKRVVSEGADHEADRDNHDDRRPQLRQDIAYDYDYDGDGDGDGNDDGDGDDEEDDHDLEHIVALVRGKHRRQKRFLPLMPSLFGHSLQNGDDNQRVYRVSYINYDTNYFNRGVKQSLPKAKLSRSGFS